VNKEDVIRSQTGRALDELTLENLLAGNLTPDDFRISAETLCAQAEAAEAAGYRQVAENFRRAAELTQLSNEEVLAMYTTLRPGRTTYTQLIALAERLENALAAPLTAALVREAAEVYRERGLVDTRRDA
jgi:propanediol dehydratase small subunit